MAGEPAQEPSFDPSNGIDTPARSNFQTGIDRRYHEARVKHYSEGGALAKEPDAAERLAAHKAHLETLGGDASGLKSVADYKPNIENAVADSLDNLGRHGIAADRSDDNVKAMRAQAGETLVKLQPPIRFSQRLFSEAMEAAARFTRVEEHARSGFAAEEDRIAEQVLRNRGGLKAVDDALSYLGGKDSAFLADLKESGALTSASYRIFLVNMVQSLKAGEK